MLKQKVSSTRKTKNRINANAQVQRSVNAEPYHVPDSVLFERFCRDLDEEESDFDLYEFLRELHQ